jgi:hypothetical protein
MLAADTRPRLAGVDARRRCCAHGRAQNLRRRDPPLTDSIPFVLPE